MRIRGPFKPYHFAILQEGILVQDCGTSVSILDLNQVHQLDQNPHHHPGHEHHVVPRWDYRVPMELRHFAVDVRRNVLIQLEIR